MGRLPKLLRREPAVPAGAGPAPEGVAASLHERLVAAVRVLERTEPAEAAALYGVLLPLAEAREKARRALLAARHGTARALLGAVLDL